ncbi:2-oxoglutarate dehydrogenase, E2 component, dihydrolipoamide succinyltransferase [Streptomyces tubbatahanensis]|uniref:Dihydrolipoamide acetyltransferase component of pyruvate dehydrogenase complex n=1 Tax=Streptomyces tubbatahanensis TaxID=2923272 RepID=A0ABY3XPF0_9ACTN|nr:2-oxoglutarate dehydrogenase, E2 component, dihydrolipoamide succinyltransferase [Streptomyces tubbatahanensis]UNS96290.1 2-oxoglutarate dehydrogenase, E2 component, dihydrolipoamide succinyltransferase [Streptomyces tubbatahanensis]
MAREAQDVVLPELGESVTEGTVTRWLKQVGDEVEADEPLLEVSTDKVDTEIPAPASGTLLEITVDEDGTAQVGAKLAVIGAPDEASPPAPPSPQPGAQPDAGPAPAPVPAPGPTAARTDADAHARPTAGTDAGVTPAAQGTGPGPIRAAGPGADRSAGPADPGGGTAQGAGPAGRGPASRPSSEGVYATPLVRKLAREHGVDLTALAGTGAGGRVRAQDVTAAAAVPGRHPAPVSSTAAPSAPHVSGPEGRPASGASPRGTASGASPRGTASGASPRGTTVAMDPARRAVGDAMMRALHGQAQLTTVVEVDVTEVARLRARAADTFAAREGVPLTMLPFLVLAAARALKAHPAVHARINEDDGTVTYFGTEDLALPVDTERGLVSPVLRDAGGLGLAGIARAAFKLAADARADRLPQDASTGATFTVGESGARGVLFETPIVPPDQTAALALGTPVARPVAVGDARGGDVLAVRRMAHLALSYDHRLVDGADAARYLAAVKQGLEGGSFAAEPGL